MKCPSCDHSIDDAEVVKAAASINGKKAKTGGARPGAGRPKKRQLLILGKNGLWATAATLDEAKLKAGSPRDYNVYSVKTGTTVSQHGALLWLGDDAVDAPYVTKRVRNGKVIWEGSL